MMCHVRVCVVWVHACVLQLTIACSILLSMATTLAPEALQEKKTGHKWTVENHNWYEVTAQRHKNTKHWDEVCDCFFQCFYANENERESSLSRRCRDNPDTRWGQIFRLCVRVIRFYFGTFFYECYTLKTVLRLFFHTKVKQTQRPQRGEQVIMCTKTRKSPIKWQ